ncbi:MAG: hypothetical protein QOF48_569 [Verrucomicrobiota bacterium]|jgi:hypothetical protein
MKTFVGLSVLAGVAGSSVVACDLCAVYSAPLAHHVHDAGFHIGVSEQFTHFASVQEDGREVPNVFGQRMNSFVSQVLVGYQITDRVGVQFNVPIIHRSFRRIEGGGIQNGTESGFGDVSLLGNFVVLRRDNEEWSFAWQILGGVKFPTGNTDRLHEELEEEPPGAGPESAIHGHDLTLGSGSYDGIVGTEVYARWRRLFFTAGMQYSIRSRGEIGYRFANDLSWSGGPGVHVVFAQDWVVGVQANISGEHKGKDDLKGEAADDTAITAVYVGPQLTVTWKARLTAELGAGWPVHLDNSAFQSVPDYRILAAVNWRF